MQLVASMLGNKYPLARCVNRETLTIAYPSGETICRRKWLVSLVRVIIAMCPRGS